MALNLTFHANGAAATGIQWTMNFSSTDFSSVTVAATSLATGVGEVVSCNTLSDHSTCLMINLSSSSTIIPDGVVAIATFHIASATTNTSSQITLTGLSATTGIGGGLALTGTGATVTINQPVTPALSNLTCTPGSLTPPGSASCTVTLTGNATSTLSVALSSNSGLVTVPASVSISSGTSSASFTASAPTAVSSSTSATLTASLNGNSRNFSLGLSPAQVTQPAVSSLACNPNTLTGGTNGSCTVYLAAAAPAGGTTVSLSSNNSNAIPPATVSVPAGQTSAGFTVTTLAVNTAQTATLSATSASVTKTASLTLEPVQISLSSLTCSPGTIGSLGSSSCTVQLTAAAPGGGTTVALSSNSPSVTVPASVSIPSGSASAVFTAAAGTVSANVTAVLTATLSGVNRTFSLTVSSQLTLVSVGCNPATVPSGGTSSCSVTSSIPAPSGGTVVTLTSSNAKVTVPPSVTIQAGATAVTFTATVAADASSGAASIQASAASVVVSTTLTIGQTQSAATLTCIPSTVQTPGNSTCTLALSSPAPTSTVVTLASTSTSVTIPPSVTIGSGQTSATFTASAASLTSTSTVTLTASVGGASQSLALLPPGANNGLSVNAVSCSPLTLTGGGTSVCQVTMSGAAPSGGVSVQLSSSSTQVSVPSTVQAAGGNALASFNVTSGLIDHDESAFVTARLNTSSAQGQLTLVGLKLASIACSPKSEQGGSPVTCLVSLNSGQAANSVTVAVSSSSSDAAAPATVANQVGQATASFQAPTHIVTSNESVRFTATYHGATAVDTVTLTPQAPVLRVPGAQSALAGKTTTFMVAASDPVGLAVTLSVSGLPPGSSFNTNTDTFTWVPDVSQIGGYTVQFTATNSAGVSSSANVLINVGSATPVILAMDNAASWANDGGCSPGAVVTLLGAGFVHAPGMAAEISPIPTLLNSVQVKADGVSLPVFYASENQVNLQCPQLAPGEAMNLVLESDTGSSSPLATKMLYATPGIFTLGSSGKGQGAVLIAGTNELAMPVTAGIHSRPVKPGEYISIFANGVGVIDTDLPPGHAAPLDKLIRVTAPVDVLVGGSAAEVTFAGLAPGFTGLYQVNARIPDSAQSGDAVSLQIVVHLPDGTLANSNIASIAIQGN